MGMAVLTVGSSMQNDPVVSKASELFRLGLMPSVELIKSGQVSQPVSITTVTSGKLTWEPTELA